MTVPVAPPMIVRSTYRPLRLFSRAGLSLAACWRGRRAQRMNLATSVLSRVHPVLDRRQHSAAAISTKTARRRILLVDDEAPVRELLRLHLSLAGFEIDEVAEGTTALERARAERFDLIVLDVMVPGL